MRSLWSLLPGRNYNSFAQLMTGKNNYTRQSIQHTHTHAHTHTHTHMWCTYGTILIDDSIMKFSINTSLHNYPDSAVVTSRWSRIPVATLQKKWKNKFKKKSYSVFNAFISMIWLRPGNHHIFHSAPSVYENVTALPCSVVCSFHRIKPEWHFRYLLLHCAFSAECAHSLSLSLSPPRNIFRPRW